MPYLLPNDPTLNELECMLVFYPNRVEYRRALLGQIIDLTKYWFWEPDGAGGQNVAADAWDEAVAETLECHSVSFCADLLATLERIEECVCAGQNITGPTTYGVDDGSDLYPYSGPAPLPPDGPDLSVDPYPVTPQSDLNGDGFVDQAEWEDYVCGAANFVVDALIDWFDFCIFIKQLNILWNDALGALLPIIARYVPGTIDDAAVIAIGLAQDAANHFQAVTIQMLEDGKVALEAQRNALNCAMVGELTADDAAAAFLAVLSGAGVDASIIALLQTGPMFFLASMIWNAAFDHDIAYSCNCDDPVSFTHVTGQTEMSVGYNGWQNNGTSRLQSTSGACGGDWVFAFPGNTNVQCTDGDAANAEGVTLPSPRVGHVQQVRMNVCHVVGSWRIEVFYQDGTSDVLTGSDTGLITFTPPNRHKEILEHTARCITIASGPTGFHTNLIEVDYYIEEGVT